MDFLLQLIDVLEISIKKNGTKQLTNLYLLNILKIVEKDLVDEEERLFKSREDIWEQVANS